MVRGLDLPSGETTACLHIVVGLDVYPVAPVFSAPGFLHIILRSRIYASDVDGTSSPEVRYLVLRYVRLMTMPHVCAHTVLFWTADRDSDRK